MDQSRVELSTGVNLLTSQAMKLYVTMQSPRKSLKLLEKTKLKTWSILHWLYSELHINYLMNKSKCDLFYFFHIKRNIYLLFGIYVEDTLLRRCVIQVARLVFQPSIVRP